MFAIDAWNFLVLELMNGLNADERAMKVLGRRGIFMVGQNEGRQQLVRRLETSNNTVSEIS
jgi:hypothetical protein